MLIYNNNVYLRENPVPNKLYIYFTRTDFFWDAFRQLIRAQVKSGPMFLIGFLHSGQQMSPVVSDNFRNSWTAFRSIEMPFRNFPISQSCRVICLVELKTIYDTYYNIYTRGGKIVARVLPWSIMFIKLQFIDKIFYRKNKVFLI